MTSLPRTALLGLALFTACEGEAPAPAEPPAATSDAPPAEPPTSEAPPPEVPTVASTLSGLPVSPLHSREKAVIAALAALCVSDCAPVLAAANDETLPAQHREALWWGILESVKSRERPELREAARRALDHPSTPPDGRRAAAYLVIGAPDGRAYLEGVFRSSERADTRAAAGCALIESLPITRWREYKADPATVDAMGICATPWHYGQREGPPG